MRLGTESPSQTAVSLVIGIAGIAFIVIETVSDRLSGHAAVLSVT